MYSNNKQIHINHIVDYSFLCFQISARKIDKMCNIYIKYDNFDHNSFHSACDNKFVGNVQSKLIFYC